MFKILESVQNGLLTAKSYEYSVANERMYNLNLSNYMSLERFHTAPVNAMDIERIEERFLISGSKNGALCIHDLQNTSSHVAYEAKIVCSVPYQSPNAHEYCINTVQFHPYDSGAFVSSGMDGQLRIWDTNSMRPDLQIRLNQRIYCHHISPVLTTKEIIAVGMKHPHCLLVDPRKGGDCHELRGHEKTVPCVRWSPLAEYILATGGGDGRILLWDVRSARGPVRAFDQHNGEAMGGRQESYKAHGGTVNGLRFTDDGLHLVSIGADNAIRLWDVVLGTNTLVNYGLTINNSNTRQRCIEICGDTNPPVLFVPSSNYILILELFTGERIKTLVGHFSLVNYCLYRSSHHQLISGANDNNILLWTPDVEAELAEHRYKKGEEDDEKCPPPAEDEDNWSSDGEGN